MVGLEVGWRVDLVRGREEWRFDGGLTWDVVSDDVVVVAVADVGRFGCRFGVVVVAGRRRTA